MHTMISKENVLCPIDPIVPIGYFNPLVPYPVSDFLSKLSAETSTVVFFPSFPFQYHNLLVQP